MHTLNVTPGKVETKSNNQNPNAPNRSPYNGAFVSVGALVAALHPVFIEEQCRFLSKVS
jgi:hypothetical protein